MKSETKHKELEVTKTTKTVQMLEQYLEKQRYSGSLRLGGCRTKLLEYITSIHTNGSALSKCCLCKTSKTVWIRTNASQA